MSKRSPQSWRIPYEPPKSPFAREGTLRLIELLVMATVFIVGVLAIIALT